MSSRWPRQSFADLYAIPSRNGISVPVSERGTGVALLNMGELFAQARIGTPTSMALVPLPTGKEQQWLVKPGDLLFGRRSLVLEGAGRCSIVGESAVDRTFESSLIRVRLDLGQAQPDFYFYYFSSTTGRQLMSTIVEQVAVAGIRSSDLARLQVPFPPLDEQRRIAGILGALDDLIDSNERLGGAMEALLGAEFDRHRFDVGGGARLDQLVEVNPSYPKPRGVAAYVDMKALPTDSYSVEYVDERPAQGGARFMNGDTLLARITPCLENGKAAFVDRLGEAEVAVGSTEFIVMKPRAGVPSVWPYFLARSGRFREFAIRQMSGTTGRQRLGADSVAAYSIATLEQADLDRFATAAAPLFAAMKALNEESAQLRRTRDELLPLLMSGKVRVADTALEGLDSSESEVGAA